MGKTERILNNLPTTFRPFPRPTRLYTLANAVGLPMQEGENLLVEVMKSHWVDYADLGRDTIRDLALLADLYDLDPRPDESVEAFRKHLKRYVSTYLEGTATVRGILRIAADTLGVMIDPDALQKPEKRVIIAQDDVTRLLFGVPWAEAKGTAAQPAEVVGQKDLSVSVNLLGQKLRLFLNGQIETIAFDAVLPLSSAAQLGEIVQAIADVFGPGSARHDGQHLILRADTPGADGRIDILSPDGPDAADSLLGIAPRVYTGTAETTAAVVSTIDHSGGIDLSENRYLRLVVDNMHLAEVDCAGAVAAATTLEEVKDKINDALPIDVAEHDDHFLTLTSPTVGSGGNIEVRAAAANDAAETLFGPGVHGFYAGSDDLAAVARSRRPLTQPVNLQTDRFLVISVDGGPPVEVDCAGAAAAETTIEEITAKLDAVNGLAASHDGAFMTLVSEIAGANSSLEILTAVEGDAANSVLGFAPRSAIGTDAAAARIEGGVDLRPSVDLRWRCRITLGMDGETAVVINTAGPEAKESTPEQIATAVNAQIGQNIATVNDGRLVLTSPTVGEESNLALISRDRPASTDFVTQAPVLDEAALLLFGFIEKHVTAEAAQAAQVTGTADLSQGVDLRERAYLQLGVDDVTLVDIDCRGLRPRVTLLDEIVAKINEALGAVDEALAGVAGHDGSHLVLTSPRIGTSSRIVVAVSPFSDAAERLLGLPEALVAGRESAPILFEGTADLSLGLDVKDQYLLKIGVDDLEPVQIDLRQDLEGNIPEELPEILLDLFDISDRINAGLGRNVASHNGSHIILRSAETGPSSRLVIEVPDEPAHEATTAVLGITAPRSYVGQVEDAQIRGLVDLSGNIDLSEKRFLRLSVDGGEPVDVDCAGETPEATTLADVVTAVNNAFGGVEVARDEGGYLVLNSPTPGAEGLLIVMPSTLADATADILGEVVGIHQGRAAAPATLTGEAVLFGPIDLSDRSGLCLAVDDGPPVTVDVAGPTPGRTFSDEIVAALNAAFPRPKGSPFAALTPDSFLQLTAEKSISLLPLRYVSLVEFPIAPAPPVSLNVVHGSEWETVNDGVDAAPVVITLTTKHGVVGATFANWSSRSQVLVPAAVGPGQTLWVALDEEGQPQAAVDGLPVSLELTPTAAALRLPPGVSQWQYTECYSSRFDHDWFDAARFAGGQCRVLAVFDQSHFVVNADDAQVAVFTPGAGLFDAETTVTLSWQARRPGRFEVELPYDLPRQFGGRFDEARFDGALQDDQLPQAAGLIIEMNALPNSLLEWVVKSPLVAAVPLAVLPPGMTPRQAPWSRPVFFEGGTADTPARLILTEEGLGGFLEFSARTPGEWGNRIQMVLAKGETAGTYDVSLGYSGEDVFENARAKVAEQVIRARAAGVESRVTRQIRGH